jgi:hypothetical protein
VRAALFVHVVQRCISAGLVGHACEDSDQESSAGDERNAESAAISGAHGPYTETVDFLEGPADPAPDHSCWAKSRMWQAARQTRRAERVRGP